MPTESLSFEQARALADHLRARAEVREARPVGLVLLSTLLLVSALNPARSGAIWLLSLLAALVLGPLLLRQVLPAGNRWTYRLSLFTFGLNTFLLGGLCYLEAVKLPPLEVEELPVLAWTPLALALLVPLGHLVALFPGWIRRWRHHDEVCRFLEQPEPPEGWDAFQADVEAMLSAAPGPDQPWATFRTVPPNPKDLKRFLRPDLTEHGPWRVLLRPRWALVVAGDGSRAEAVPRGGLKLVTDDAEAAMVLCLIRWNQHFHEGRIAPEEARKLMAWMSEAPAA